MTSSFPLLRLPSLALAEVVQHMDLLQMLYLTCFTSQKAYSLAKKFTKKIAIELSICHRSKKSVGCRMVGSSDKFIRLMIFDPENSEGHRDQIPQRPSRSNFHGNFGLNLQIFGFMFNGEVWTCWNHVSNAFRAMMNFFANNFTVQTVSYGANGDKEGREVNILKHAKQLGFALDKVDFLTFGLTGKEARELLSSCASAQVLIFCSRMSRKFTVPTEELQKLAMNTLVIYFSHWVKLEHVLAMGNIRVVRLDESRLSNNDMNIILKKWISNSLNFDQMIIDPSDYDKKAIMQGIDAERIPDELFFEERDNMFEVRRADNTIGVIEFRGYDIKFWVAKEQD